MRNGSVLPCAAWRRTKPNSRTAAKKVAIRVAVTVTAHDALADWAPNDWHGHDERHIATPMIFD